jgi:heme exporter protein D
MSEPSPTQNDYNNNGQGPMVTLSSDTAKVTLASSEESASSVSAGLYFFIVWLVLLILIITLLCITIDCRCKRKVNQQQQQQQQHEQQSHDTEAGEQQTSTMQIETRSKKFNNGIGITVLFLGSLIGLGLSVFSIITCEFVTLDRPLTTDMFYTIGITVYSLGMWKVDLTSNSSLSGCVDTSLHLFKEDALYKFAKVSSVIASVIGGISPLILMFLLIIPSSVKKIRYLVWPFLLAAFFQLMTLTLFGSSYCKYDGNNNCQFSLGAIASISAAVYWILGVFAARFINFIDPTVDPSYST